MLMFCALWYCCFLLLLLLLLLPGGQVVEGSNGYLRHELLNIKSCVVLEGSCDQKLEALDVLQTASRHKCKFACIKNDACQGFEVNYKTKVCKLFASTPKHAKSQDNVDCYRCYQEDIQAATTFF